MTDDHLGWVEISRHLRQMRVTTGLFLATVPAAIAVAFLAPYRGSSVASPLAVHGDESRLLRDHWLVYLAVLVRLEMMVVCGLIVSLWGMGPGIGIWLLILGALMMALTWPTARKTQLLLGRARALRDDI